MKENELAKYSLIADYNDLMRHRIEKVLLICSTYDSFALEEDGQIEAQIKNEYAELGLSNPPTFMRVSSAREAAELLEERCDFDLIITMMNVGSMDVFEFADLVKQRYPQVPLVLLAHLSRDLSLKIEERKRSLFDYIFCWTGNADLILAVIKLIEDKMNAPTDITGSGVQAILLVEDSIRYYSTYLPLIYKLILHQNQEFIKEILNTQQAYRHRRARPKILLAQTFDEAVEIYETYRENTLGIISDISFRRRRGGEEMPNAGLELCRIIKADNPLMPFLLQSSREDTRIESDRLAVGFVHKYSKTLLIDLSNYITKEFSFGDLVFTDPRTGEVAARVRDLAELQEAIRNIDLDVLLAHTSQNSISKWMFARGLFGLGRILKAIKNTQFENPEDIRSVLIEQVRRFRIMMGQGITADFDPARFNKYVWFSRMGGGSVGGKGRGLAFANSVLQQHRFYDRFEGVQIAIPRTLIIATDYFDEFIIENGLQSVINSDMTDGDILSEFVGSRLPQRVVDNLRIFLNYVNRPLAIRSSSKLEDSYYQPFAGIYSTYMIPYNANKDQMLRQLGKAIKSVYASTYYAAARAYINATANVLAEEKMAVVLQEVCGSEENGIFFPTLSGVARSVNFYPIGDEKADEGIVNLAFGLGKQVVEGGQTLRFSPHHPKKVLQLSTPELALRDTQREFYALDLRPESFRTSTDDAVNLRKTEINKAADLKGMKPVLSTWDMQNQQISDSSFAKGRKIVTFASILKYDAFPLAEIINQLLAVGKQEMKNEVEIEFAVDMTVPKGEGIKFRFLQIRPIVRDLQREKIDWTAVPKAEALVYAEAALGLGEIRGLRDVVYVREEAFDAAHTHKIAAEAERLNARFREKNRNYILIGPGRWGSGDPWLGVPVKWPAISQARVIIESGLKDFRVDPSQGTHFFQNLTSFGVGYMTLNPHIGNGIYDIARLDAMEAEEEGAYLRHVRFPQPLYVFIDGVENKGVIIEKNRMP